VTLAEQMAADAVAIHSLDDHAEELSYIPNGFGATPGAAKDVHAIVDRAPVGPDYQLRGTATRRFEVSIPRDATVGLTSVLEGADKVMIELVPGDNDPKPFRVERLIAVDHGSFRLRCVK